MADEPASALTGAAFDLVNAGYRPMPDGKRKEDEAIGSDGPSLREAAERLSDPPDELVVREYRDGEGKPVAANEAITLERAGRDYAGLIAAERLAAEADNSEELAAHVDAMRAEALAGDPDAAEFYGVELPEEESEETEADEDGAETDENYAGAESRLDPELERALQHPQVRHAIEQQIAEVDKTRQSYLDGLVAATQLAQASFLGQFPELAATPPESLPAALEQMSRQDPAGFSRVQAIVATAERLFAQQQHEGRHQNEIDRQNFLSFARSEDARLDAMLASEPRETQRAVTEEIFASAKASGIERAELLRLFDSEPLMRNAVFQRMMYDAGKYRLLMKARDATVAKHLPPVQRPGSAATRAERERADLGALTAKLAGSGDIRDAVALYNARRSGRR